MATNDAKLSEVLLLRRGLVYVHTMDTAVPERLLYALEVELAELGYVLAQRLRARLSRTGLSELLALRRFVWATLATESGAKERHVPLFRSFPEGVPEDTHALWLACVLVHFLQAEGQPCLHCMKSGTTHVLEPCKHVVCDHCFDGRSYAGCPVCGAKLRAGEPFCKPSPADERALPLEKVRFKLLDLGADLHGDSEDLLARLCARKQALSPSDRSDLVCVVTALGARALEVLPVEIPVRENVAMVFGALLTSLPAPDVMPHARRYLQTATDILRLLAAYSGADPSLGIEVRHRLVARDTVRKSFWGKAAELIIAGFRHGTGGERYVPIRIKRFKMGKLSRPLRRELLGLMEGFAPARLTEDMLRHRSYWVWVGEFLHPHEYAERYPQVAAAFAVVRKKATDGTKAPTFRGFYAELEAAAAASDADGFGALLAERPGELARRFDHALRIAGDDVAAAERLLARLLGSLSRLPTPLLLTLRGHLPARIARQKVRMYFPKGAVTKGIADTDRRRLLSPSIARSATGAIEAELLRRFGGKPRLGTAIIDTALRDVIAPFNERTASPAAVALPRGSQLAVPPKKLVRLFIHWCEPETKGYTTDVDLSVGFYAADWSYRGVCSYYEQSFHSGGGGVIARSSGDFTSAPFPEGASEFIDLHRDEARAAGIRYAVMVVNAYAGMPFSALERCFAGLMLRDDEGGRHFDPRAVELKFTLQGDNGVFMPLVLDLETSTLHWLDVYATDQLAMNNVATSNADIKTICPNTLDYFASGVRISLFDLALLHGAARAQRVVFRGAASVGFERAPGENAQFFLRRIRAGEGAGEARLATLETPVLAMLHKGDLALPEGSAAYALFREGLVTNLSASDLSA
jgi:hypothetical protein